MAIYLRIEKVRETPTEVEYAVLKADGPMDETLVVDKQAVETQLETVEDPNLRRALVMAASRQRKTGTWPTHLVKQS